MTEVGVAPPEVHLFQSGELELLVEHVGDARRGLSMTGVAEDERALYVDQGIAITLLLPTATLAGVARVLPEVDWGVRLALELAHRINVGLPLDDEVELVPADLGPMIVSTERGSLRIRLVLSVGSSARATAEEPLPKNEARMAELEAEAAQAQLCSGRLQVKAARLAVLAALIQACLQLPLLFIEPDDGTSGHQRQGGIGCPKLPTLRNALPQLTEEYGFEMLLLCSSGRTIRFSASRPPPP